MILTKSEQVLFYMATHDALTGLPNALLFELYLEQAIKKADRDTDGLCIMVLDLDNFKEINDSRGHEEGDKFLRAASMKFRSILRKGDIIARRSGDEFLILLPTNNRYIIRTIIHRIHIILQSIQKDIYITISIGVAKFPDNASNVKNLLNYADMKMYEVKKEKQKDI